MEQYNIERGIQLEAESVAEFGTGGWGPIQKTKRARTKWFNKSFVSNKKKLSSLIKEEVSNLILN